MSLTKAGEGEVEVSVVLQFVYLLGETLSGAGSLALCYILSP
jgi:hypothetical protein